MPEGIIFQSQTAYCELRKMLVEKSLVAVVSLPAGVFNPYSGVKTSILILDRAAAKAADTIAFFKIENDGFGLGAQRRAVKGSQLPQVKAELAKWLAEVRAGRDGGLESTLGHAVAKARIGEGEDYNLSGARYREKEARPAAFPTIRLGEVCDLIGGATPSKQNNAYWQDGTVKWLSCRHIGDDGRINGFELISEQALRESSTRVAPTGSTILVTRVSVGKAAWADSPYAINQDLTALVSRDEATLLPQYLFAISGHLASEVERNAEGIGVRGVTRNYVANMQIPLPPLEVQREIVEDIESSQRVINGAQMVLDSYHPHIPVHPEWPVIPLPDACLIQRGKFSHRPRNEPRFYGGEYPFIQTGDIVRSRGGRVTYTQTLNADGLSVSKLFQPPVVLVTIAANIGDTAVLDFPACFPDSIVGLVPRENVDARFLEFAMREQQEYLNDIAPQSAQKNINIEILKALNISLPSLDIQRAIVAEIEAEQALVNANRDLITRFERKVEATIARIWGDENVEDAG